jgi:lysyl-tRNA synthetase class I
MKLLFIQKLWVYIKQYWLYVVFALGFIGYIVFSFSKKTDYDKLLEDYQKQRDSYRKQLEDLQKVHEEEERKHAKAEEDYRKLIERLQLEYQTNLTQIANAKKDDIMAILLRTQNDPLAMTRELNVFFGIPIFHD